MLSAIIVNDEIETTGEVEPGDVYPGVCCAGWGWTALHVFPDPRPEYNSVWGQCDNPACPDPVCVEHDHSTGTGPEHCAACADRGISSMMQEDLAEKLATAAEII